MSQQSNKNGFVQHADPDVFVRMEKIKRPWMKHSVAVLIVAPRVDRVVLVLPSKAANRQSENVRVPPQQVLLKPDSVKRVAAHIMSEVLITEKLFDESQPMSDSMVYLGSGKGNAHRGDAIVPHGKWIHWVGVHLQRMDRVFQKNSGSFKVIQWCSANQLLNMNTIVMSDRKYLMTLQALAAFTTMGIEGSITYKAHKTLAA